MTIKKSYQVLKILLKDISKKHTVTSLANERGVSRVMSWKILKELQKENLIILTPVGLEKTSVLEVRLNWDNIMLEKTLALLLAEDALKQNKWRYNFKELEDEVNFLILFGSTLHSPKEANDIDILVVTSNEKGFSKIDKIFAQIQITQSKKIHFLNFTEDGLKIELKKENRAYIESIKKGVILFGQEKFIKFIRDIY